MSKVYNPVACALVDESGDVVNVIMADPAFDPIPDGYKIMPRPLDVPVGPEWQLTEKGDGFEIKPEVVAAEALAADAVATDAEVKP